MLGRSCARRWRPPSRGGRAARRTGRGQGTTWGDLGVLYTSFMTRAAAARPHRAGTLTAGRRDACAGDAEWLRGSGEIQTRLLPVATGRGFARFSPSPPPIQAPVTLTGGSQNPLSALQGSRCTNVMSRPTASGAADAQVHLH